MDTITYLPDPADPSRVVSVITDHSKFELDQGTTIAEEIYALHYDEYDRMNCEDAKEFLFNSIDKELKMNLYENTLPEISFASLFLERKHPGIRIC